ncbi:hypothetical protein TNCV_59901 [Trichonephila clavipes]|nr:hypothetical protein TNCV_59901 [Trichonephila clavipes]
MGDLGVGPRNFEPVHDQRQRTTPDTTLYDLLHHINLMTLSFHRLNIHHAHSACEIRSVIVLECAIEIHRQLCQVYGPNRRCVAVVGSFAKIVKMSLMKRTIG